MLLPWGAGTRRGKTVVRNIRRRLAKLEESLRPSAGRCPYCPPPGPLVFVEVDEEGNVLSGEYPPWCARCGGPSGTCIEFIEVVVAPPSESGEPP
jgi:hypothetical protein